MIFPGTGMSTADTGQLVLQARRGDAGAFEELVRRHMRAAFAVAFGITGNEADAEDVVQDSFVTALQRLDDCRDAARFSAWLMRIVRNRSLNYIRDERRHQAAPLDTVVVEARDNPARDTERVLLREDILREVESLTGLQRQVLLLHDLEGFRHREVAEALDISEVSSRVHLLAARRALRVRLNGRYSHERS
jgi:RNA polymerase sigma-70 factor (ECF subfamily)